MPLIRLVCVAYCILLTVLLLVPDPSAMLGIDEVPEPPGGRGVHFLGFAGMALLVCASRWPLRPGLLIGILGAHALATETLQWFIPPRSVELLDYLENFLGLAAGVGIWSLVRRRSRRSAAEQPDPR